jgi:hypothetical protein
MVERLLGYSPAATILKEAAHDLGLADNWQERVRTAGEEDLPSCFPVTDLATASIGVADALVAFSMNHHPSFHSRSSPRPSAAGPPFPAGARS